MTIPVTYKINDYNWEKIQGSFYEQELQKTSESTFRIENVLKRQGDKCLVKWMGYPNSFNSWINTKAILKLIKGETALQLLRIKTLIKTCFNKHDIISFNIY